MGAGLDIPGWLFPAPCVLGCVGCTVGCCDDTVRHSRKATHHTARYSLILPTGLIREIPKSVSRVIGREQSAKRGSEGEGWAAGIPRKSHPKKRRMIGAPTLIIPIPPG